MKELKFALQLKELPVSITDIDGVEKAFTLRELSGIQRDRFLNEMGGRMKFNAAGKMSGLNNYADIQAGFLALCLYDETNSLVSVENLRKYPSSVLSDLFEAAQELSKLDKGVNDSKNDLAASD